MARKARNEGAEVGTCPLLAAENVAYRHDMGNGTGSLVTFRLGNLTGGVTVTAMTGGDGMALACEFARRALMLMEALT
ncbi:MAG: hypothetical protein GWN58_10075 [Anaerolineae bacterium]|nr:hypothetical protein [Anaerolineae bacterium]